MKDKSQIKKILGIPKNIWMVLGLFVILASASLITLYSTYNVGQEQLIEVEGITPPLSVDGVGLISETYDMPDDIFSDGYLEAGETEVFLHTITNDDNRIWRATFTIQNTDQWDDPGDVLYGYYPAILDNSDVEITSIDIGPSLSAIFKCHHDLDSAFADTTETIPWDLDILLEKLLLDLSPNLHVVLHCNDGSGTTVSDSSLNGYDFTISGVESWSTDSKLGSHAISSASDNSLTESTGNAGDFESSDSFSCEIWIKPTGFTNSPNLMRKFSVGLGVGWLFYLEPSGYPIMKLFDGTGNLQRDCDTALTTGTYQHLVCTYDGSSTAAGVKFYINGAEKTGTTSSDTLTGSIINIEAMKIMILFDGTYDEVVVYDKVLNADEIEFRYNLGAGTELFGE